jgi:predicted house-cleaning noncanonical NTP pyrophosphatase (MazG superfamily)
MTEKLVRDRIPEIIFDETKVYPTYRFATPVELPNFQLRKLREEVTELGIALTDGTLENVVNELADVSEVLSAMGVKEKPASSVVRARVIEKRHDRGGFKYGIVMDF